MSPGEMAVLLAVIGVVMLVAELFLPSQGVLTLAGVLSLLGTVVASFFVSAQTGFVVLAGLVILSPFAIMGALRVWPRTWVGRRMTLAGVATTATAPAPLPTHDIAPGTRGVTLTELRPIGMCEINGERVEAVSELNLIRPGTAIEVVTVQASRPIVRPVSPPTDAI